MLIYCACGEKLVVTGFGNYKCGKCGVLEQMEFPDKLKEFCIAGEFEAATHTLYKIQDKLYIETLGCDDTNQTYLIDINVMLDMVSNTCRGYLYRLIQEYTTDRNVTEPKLWYDNDDEVREVSVECYMDNPLAIYKNTPNGEIVKLHNSGALFKCGHCKSLTSLKYWVNLGEQHGIEQSDTFKVFQLKCPVCGKIMNRTSDVAEMCSGKTDETKEYSNIVIENPYTDSDGMQLCNRCKAYTPSEHWTTNGNFMHTHECGEFGDICRDMLQIECPVCGSIKETEEIFNKYRREVRVQDDLNKDEIEVDTEELDPFAEILAECTVCGNLICTCEDGLEFDPFKEHKFNSNFDNRGIFKAKRCKKCGKYFCRCGDKL